MFNFITNLLNINPNDIDSLNTVTLDSKTHFYITLRPNEYVCPCYGGSVQSHGHLNISHMIKEMIII